MSDLIRFKDPFLSLSGLHSQLDDLFNNFFGSSLPTLSSNIPAMDVYTEGDKQLVAEVHAPGFTKDDVEVSVNEGTLEIRGNKKSMDEDKDDKRSYMVRESSSSFYRRIMLPKYADGSKVKASFDEGVLKVIVPFKELPQPKKIAIESSKK